MFRFHRMALRQAEALRIKQSLATVVIWQNYQLDVATLVVLPVLYEWVERTVRAIT